MEPELVRQFVSKAARCKARAAFELCAPVSVTSGNESKIPDAVLNCRLLAPCGLRMTRPAPHRLATGLPTAG